MARVARPTIYIVTEGEAPHLFSLDHAVMVRLADAFEFAFPEERLVALMRDAMVRHRGRNSEALSKAPLAQRLG